MPRLIDPGEPGPALTLDAAVEALAGMRFDAEDPGAWDAAAPVLARLSADRDFLGRVAADALAGRRPPEGALRYGPQVLMLHPGRGNWFLRANLWPAAADPLFRASGRAAFFYDLPHDHNFSFLTIGHHGPGYESEYWRYDPATVAGLPGEAVALRYAGRHRLRPGRVMLYRAHHDVHDQKPPTAFSVSLNIVEASGREPWRDQYRFDPAAGRIVAPINAAAIEGLVALAAHLGGDAGRAMVAEFARRHPVDRVRFGAVAALASAAPDEGGTAVLERAVRDGDGYVAARATAALLDAERGRRWSAATADAAEAEALAVA